MEKETYPRITESIKSGIEPLRVVFDSLYKRTEITRKAFVEHKIEKPLFTFSLKALNGIKQRVIYRRLRFA